MRMYLCCFLGVIVSSCSFNQWGRDLGGGLIEGVNEKADTVAGRFVAGALDTLTAAKTQERLAALIDHLGETLSKQAAATRDTLLGEYTRLWVQQLRHDLLGETTKQQLGEVRDELLGIRTRVLIGQLRDELLGDSTRDRVTLLRNNLLGETTRSAIDSLIRSAVATLSEEYRNKMQPLVRGEESFVKRNATELLWTAGGVIASLLGVAGLIFVRKKRDSKLLELMTYQIHEIPVRQSYDELVRRIQKKAQEEGVEPRLRELLQEHGILGEEGWKPPAQQGR